MVARSRPQRVTGPPQTRLTSIFDEMMEEQNSKRGAVVDLTYRLNENPDSLPRGDVHRTGYVLGGEDLYDEVTTLDPHYGMIGSPNWSSRGGKKVRLLIVHTAEGAQTVESLGAWFANPNNQVSSHAGIDDKRIETYVPYDQAAWTARSANSIADQVELCAWAKWTRDEWLGKHTTMLELLAGWLKDRAAARGIPLRKLSPAQVAAGESGVCGHVDWTIGMKDGTHTDPGTSFPWDVVMAMATKNGGFVAGNSVQVGPPIKGNQHVMPWMLPAGENREETIPVPTFDPTQRAEMWMVTGWQPAEIEYMYYVRDHGPGKSPVQEQWGGTGKWTLAPDDRPGFDLGQGCTSIAVRYSAPRDVQCLIRYWS